MQAMPPFLNTDLNTLLSDIKNNELPLAEYISRSLEYIEQREPTIQALLPEPQRKQRLMKEAAELQQRYPEVSTRPALYGLLVGVKDLFNANGMPTQAGSKIPAEAFVGPEAELVTRLKNLGALVLGKTVSTEFAYFFPGPTRNPLNPEYSPGGSSSGSAAAVSAGYCHLAIGTQTIASVIRPASYCGIIGFKPTQHLLSMRGVFPFSQSGDNAGLFAPRLHDILTITKALDFLPQPVLPSPPNSLTFALIKGKYWQQAQPNVQANFVDVCDNLSRKGASFVEIDPFPDLEEVIADYQALIASEFYRNHISLYEKYSHLYSEHSAQLYLKGKQVNDAELLALQQKQQELSRHIHEVLAHSACHVILCPSTTSTAPKGISTTGSPLMSLPFTAAGMPAITLPCGFNEHGLAYGLQLIAAQNEDSYLLSSADGLALLL